MKERKIFVHEDNKKYMDFVLARDGLLNKVYYEVRKYGFWLFIKATRSREKELIEDMLLEKLRAGKKCKIPYYSYRTMKNGEKRKRLANFYGTTSCRCTDNVSKAIKREVA